MKMGNWLIIKKTLRMQSRCFITINQQAKPIKVKFDVPKNRSLITSSESLGYKLKKIWLYVKYSG